MLMTPHTAYKPARMSRRGLVVEMPGGNRRTQLTHGDEHGPDVADPRERQLGTVHRDERKDHEQGQRVHQGRVCQLHLLDARRPDPRREGDGTLEAVTMDGQRVARARRHEKPKVFLTDPRHPAIAIEGHDDIARLQPAGCRTAGRHPAHDQSISGPAEIANAITVPKDDDGREDEPDVIKPLMTSATIRNAECGVVGLCASGIDRRTIQRGAIAAATSQPTAASHDRRARLLPPLVES